MKKSASDIAQEIIDISSKLGWEIRTRDTVITITKKFTPGCMNSYVECDSQYYYILSLVPTTSLGSTWGSDGSGVGAISAHKNGTFIMNKSGCSKRVLNSLSKLLVN